MGDDVVVEVAVNPSVTDASCLSMVEDSDDAFRRRVIVQRDEDDDSAKPPTSE